VARRARRLCDLTTASTFEGRARPRVVRLNGRRVAHPVAHLLLGIVHYVSDATDSAPHLTCPNRFGPTTRKEISRFLNRVPQVRILPRARSDQRLWTRARSGEPARTANRTSTHHPFARARRDAGIASTPRVTIVATASAQRSRRAHRSQGIPAEDGAGHEAQSGNELTAVRH
jgi:hypothetical protein